MTNNDYAKIREQLVVFLQFVGERILELYERAKSEPDFAKLKEDGSLVTQADVMSEKMIREWITDYFPEHAIRGEEMADKAGSGYEWIVDPIDGTHPFKHFGKNFGISVGLVKDNEPKVGVIYYPAERVILSASQKGGVYRTIDSFRLRIYTDYATKLKWTWMILGFGDSWESIPKYAERGKQLAKLLPFVNQEPFDIRSFTFGFFQFLYTPEIGAIFHCGATPYDIAAACCIAREAGCYVSGFEGEPIDFSRELIPIVISKNKELHNEIITVLNS